MRRSGPRGALRQAPRPADSPRVAEGSAACSCIATLEPQPYSTEAFDLIEPIRAAAHEAAPGTLVGGATAVEFDVREAAAWDSTVIPPIVLVVVFLILVLLLRAVVAPLILIGTVIVSYLAALGVGYFVFETIFDFTGSDPSLPLFAFVFLVALGSTQHLPHGTRAEETLSVAPARGSCARCRDRRGVHERRDRVGLHVSSRRVPSSS